MRAHPPWASASPPMSNIQLQSPSPMTTQIFKEEAPYLFGRNSASSSKPVRNSSAAGSWNILEEIRKVRSRATEEMLRTRRSSLIDWSTLASDNKTSPNSLVVDKAESVSHVAQDGVQNEVSIPDPATSVPEQSQEVEARQIVEEAEEGRLSQGQRPQPSEDMNAASQSDGDIAADGPKDGDGIGQSLNYAVGGDALVSPEVNCSTVEEVTGRTDAVAANGFPSPGSSLFPRQKAEQKLKPSDEDQVPVDSGHDMMTRTAPADEKCEHLSESHVQVPAVDENDSAATGSQNSSSMRYGGPSQDLSQPNLKRKAGKGNDVKVTEKQQGGKRRYVRKVKGRGK
ncbi:protein KAKU4 [Jatropha curcas]|nr:protein KAKU4 [Jatropha curcas]